ncbi:MAG: hypothetical protein IPG58_20185 [Acidobacteria bacterium]|nr:hypothetical protein [Acidobacteriota bacterium]
MKNSEDQILEHIIRRMQSDVAIDAPADALRYSKNLFRTRAPQPKESVLRRVLAVMRVDLAPGTAAFGERSSGEGQARQVLFDCGENAVDLRIKKAGEKFSIRGQIFGYGFENGTVELASADRSYLAKMDDVNEFRIDDVKAGDYSIIVRGSQDEILIESVPVN